MPESTFGGLSWGANGQATMSLAPQKSVIDRPSPFPFDDPMGQELWRVLVGMFPVPFDAIVFAQKFGVDPLDLPQNLPPRQLWHVLIEKITIRGRMRDMVLLARDQNPDSGHAAFLTAILESKPHGVSPEPMQGFDPPLTRPEALLFSDDLTVSVGEVPRLIETLRCLHHLAAAVCLLRVSSPYGSFFGTGFRIGTDLVLTNEHVLFPNQGKATAVEVEFGYDIDGAGLPATQEHLVGDLDSVLGHRDDDWAVVRVAGMASSWPTISVSIGPPPLVGARAFILQHPGGHCKKLGFVRNTITEVSDRHVQYLTDTQPGSSGAPVFDAGGALIAIHHRGGTPTQKPGKVPLTKNQGIRTSRVHAGLAARGLLS